MSRSGRRLLQTQDTSAALTTVTKYWTCLDPLHPCNNSALSVTINTPGDLGDSFAIQVAVQSEGFDLQVTSLDLESSPGVSDDPSSAVPLASGSLCFMVYGLQGNVDYPW